MGERKPHEAPGEAGEGQDTKRYKRRVHSDVQYNSQYHMNVFRTEQDSTTAYPP